MSVPVGTRLRRREDGEEWVVTAHYPMPEGPPEVVVAPVTFGTPLLADPAYLLRVFDFEGASPAATEPADWVTAAEEVDAHGT